MRIVVAEMLYPEGHIELNKKYIQILTEIGEVTVVDDGKYFTSMNLDNVTIINVSRTVPSVSKFVKVKKWIPFLRFDPIDFIAHFINLIRIVFKLRKVEYDRIVFFSARNDALGFALPFFKKDSVYVFHHVDLDQIMARPRYIKSFKKYMNRYHHIVLADFIKEGLLDEFEIDENRIKVIYQPLINKESLSNQERLPIVIGLGRGIDKGMLASLIEYDKSHKEPLPYKIILRDSKVDYKGNNLTVDSEYYDRNKYDYYLDNASLCVIFYSVSFNLRYSGVADDALSHGLPVVGNDIRVIRYFAEKYDGCCSILSNITEIFKLKDIHFSTCQEQFELFRENHSDIQIKSMIKEAFEC